MNKVVKYNKQILDLSYVEEVTPADFNQAQRTWEALHIAGIDPGPPVLRALNSGHDYEIKNLITEQPFRLNGQPLIGEYMMTEEVVVGYELAEKVEDRGDNILESGNRSLMTVNSSLALSEDDIISSLTVIKHKVITMSAVIKRGSQPLFEKK